MKQPLFIVGIIIAAILVFGTTFSVVKSLTMTNDISGLSSRIASLEESTGQTGSSQGSSATNLKVGVVRLNFISQEYQQIPEVKESLETQIRDYTAISRDLQQQLEQGIITQEEYDAQVQSLLTSRQEQFVNLLARPIQDAVNQIGIEQGYDLIVKAEDVILFSQGGLMEDISDTVLERMIRNRQ